jgi:hypothetical protein
VNVLYVKSDFLPYHCRADFVVVLFVCVEIRPEHVVTDKPGKTVSSI